MSELNSEVIELSVNQVLDPVYNIINFYTNTGRLWILLYFHFKSFNALVSSRYSTLATIQLKQFNNMYVFHKKH